MMEKNAKIYVAGHRGMVGSAIVRELQRQGYTNIITRTHKELDLTRQDAVEEFFAQSVSWRQKSPSMYFWQPPRSAVSLPIRRHWPTLCGSI